MISIFDNKTLKKKVYKSKGDKYFIGFQPPEVFEKIQNDKELKKYYQQYRNHHKLISEGTDTLEKMKKKLLIVGALFITIVVIQIFSSGTEHVVVVEDNIQLTGENKKLSTDNAQIQQEKAQLEQDLGKTKVEKDELATVVDQGSTFVASNIQFQAVDERRSGKERSTANAKRVDKLVVSFDVENRIAKSGPTPITIIVTNPDGQVINATETQFETREEGNKTFTAQMEVNYTKGTKQNVQYPVRGSFSAGNYKIEIYQNGYKIGEAERPLK